MYGALRIALRQARPARPVPQLNQCLIPVGAYLLTSTRCYASKAKGVKGKEKDKKAKERAEKSAKANNSERDKSWGGHSMSTDGLVPGSQQVLSGEAQAEYERADGKMKTSIDWFRREVAAKELQGSGRVTPDILKPVRVALPDMPEGETCSLTELATVGVREGTTLIVTVFAEDTLKHVEKSIYAARIPHVAPQKVDNRTLKIPLPKPTVDARAELVKSAAKLAEETRVQLRRIEQASVKKGDYKKHSLEVDEFRELLQKYLSEVDKILADMKKSLSVK
ncbi:hypothetical protein ACEPAH_1890 [Sanghuangporus vaninii]